MYCSPLNGNAYTTDDFPKTDWHRVKITNFAKLSMYDAFSLLIDGSTPGVFYTKLFIKDDWRIQSMMQRLPYLNVLTAMMAPPEVQAQIFDKINKVLTPPTPKEPIQGKEETSHEQHQGTDPQ